MSNKSIADFVKVLNDDYFLPSIQREFVWGRKEQRIEKLFDSLLQGYPIGTILTWNVDKDVASEKWEVYKFIDDYDEDNPHNKTANLSGSGVNNRINLILDGQQRLTALFIGLKGSYSYLFRGKSKKLKLYINLFKTLEDEIDNVYGMMYDIKFHEGKPESNQDEYWIDMGKVLDYVGRDAEDFKEYFDDDVEKYIDGDRDKRKLSGKILGKLHEAIVNPSLCLSEQIVKFPDDEKILNVFVRTNDGGKKLEKSDMLLSHMEANKDIFKPKGAREEIHGYVDNLNEVKENKPCYGFTKDDVLKACLVLTDGLAVQYNFKNFNKENLKSISDNWEEIKKYMYMTVDLIASYKYTSNSITAKNALIPIALYLKQSAKSNAFVHSTKQDDKIERDKIILWLTTALLTGAFGGSSDTILSSVRNKINSGDALYDIGLNSRINVDHLEKWLNREKYQSKLSHLILLLLTPSEYLSSKCDQDHMFPDSFFTDEKLHEFGIAKDKWQDYKKYGNCLVNLHLYPSSPNQSKGAQCFKDWLDEQGEDVYERELIPRLDDYSFFNFLEFIEKRRELMFNTLKDKLKVTD